MLSNAIEQAASIIKHGGVIAYATDTVLGLGCDPHCREAVDRVLWLKQRSADKGLILLVENTDAMEPYTGPLNAVQRLEIRSAQNDTPTTWVVAALEQVPVWITGSYDSVALRIPRHATAGALCRAAGTIVSTSANVSSYPVLSHSQGLRDWFGPHLDYVLTGPVGTGVPSEVRELMGVKVYRHGS